MYLKNQAKKELQLSFARDAAELTDEAPVVVGGGAVKAFKAAFLAQVLYARALFFMIFKTDGRHKTVAFTEPVARDAEIDVQ